MHSVVLVHDAMADLQVTAVHDCFAEDLESRDTRYVHRIIQLSSCLIHKYFVHDYD